jgi:tripartite-type tricarboxylate transporter receptor subunit TctC
MALKAMCAALKAMCAALLLAGAFAGEVAAQDYPNRPITVIVPFAAGGPADLLARILGGEMSGVLKQQLIIDNVNGAGGTIGTARAAKATPDGYTLLLMHVGIATAPALYRKLPYDTITDLEPIGRVADVPMTLVARKTLPPQNFQEFLPYAKANKDKLTIATAGVGSASHLCGMLLMRKIDMAFNVVPYKGNGPVMNDLVSGQIDLTCDQTTNTTEQIRGGTIKAYGVTAKSRLSAMPELATLDEQGLSGFEVFVWYGLWAPKGTPKPILDTLDHALQVAVASPNFRARMADLSSFPATAAGATPEALRTHLKSELELWATVIKQAGVVPE